MPAWSTSRWVALNNHRSVPNRSPGWRNSMSPEPLLLKIEPIDRPATSPLAPKRLWLVCQKPPAEPPVNEKGAVTNAGAPVRFTLTAPAEVASFRPIR